MQGDRDKLRAKLEIAIKNADDSLIKMNKFELSLDYNEAWAALFGLRKLERETINQQ